MKDTTTALLDTSEHKNSFLVSVAPLTRIPLLRDQSFFYTWHSDDTIPVGSLVEIPIGRRIARGVVTGVHSDFARANGITLKSVSKVLQPGFLTKEQLALAQFMYSYYYCSLGIVLKHFVPDRVRARTPMKNLPFTSMREISLSSGLTAVIDQLLQAIAKAPGGTSLLLQTTRSHETKDALITILQGLLVAHDDQILIIVSERTQIDAIHTIIRESFPESLIATLSTTMTKGAFYESWERIRGNATDLASMPRIIVGTRSTVFAPYTKLSAIIVMESHDDAYKQWDAHPRYDARRCARELSRLHDCCVLNVSASPEISAYEQHADTKTLFRLPASKKLQTTIVDMSIEYNEVNEKKITKSHPALSRALVYAIEKTLEKKQQTLLFLNHQGKNAFSVCERCKTVARCPQCERALVESNRGYHRCLHCSFVSAVFPKCVDCSSITFKNVGFGTEAIEEILEKRFPHARIARVDGEAMKKRTSYKKLHDRSITGTIDIIIGTQMSTKGWSLPRLGLASIIDMDSLLGGLDYNTHEKAYAHVLQLYSRLTLSTVHTPQLIVQAYDTTHEIVRKIQLPDAQKSWKEFVDDERSMRQILYFPPYAELIKLTYQTTDQKKIDAVAKEIYEKCIEVSLHDPAIKISEPHDPLVGKVRTKYRKQIVIKIKKTSLAEVTTIAQPLHEFLLSLDKDWIIDRDPVHLA